MKGHAVWNIAANASRGSAYALTRASEGMDSQPPPQGRRQEGREGRCGCRGREVPAVDTRLQVVAVGVDRSPRAVRTEGGRLLPPRCHTRWLEYGPGRTPTARVTPPERGSGTAGRPPAEVRGAGPPGGAGASRVAGPGRFQDLRQTCYTLDLGHQGLCNP